MTALAATAQDELFSKYDDARGVETVFISKAMLSLVSKQDLGDMKINVAASKLDRIQVLSCEQAALSKTIVADAQRIFKRDKYELMMKTKDDDEQTYIYMKQRGKKNEFVVLDVDGSEVNVVNLLGTLTLADIKNITK